MTDPARIVRIIARLNVGGPARQVILLDGLLRAAGWESLLLHGIVGPGEASLEDLAAEREVPTSRIVELGRRVRPWSDFVAFARVLRTLFRIRPDVIHTHTAKAGAIGRIAAAVYNATRRRPRRALVVHTFHGHVLDGYFGPMQNMAVRALERGLARVSDRIVAISERQRRDLTAVFNVAPAELVSVVPLGLELRPLLEVTPSVEARAQLGLEPDAVVIAFIGRLVPIKRPSLLLESFATVAKACPRARLLVVGDGELRVSAQDDVRRRGLASRVIFTGWRHDLDAVYAATDLVVLTSRNEGTPVALIEAMAAGVAVVSTDVGGVSDLVETDRTGVLVPSDASPGAIADELLRLIGDGDRRRRLGDAGRAHVRDRHDAARLAADLDNLYRRGLMRKRHLEPAL